LDSENIAWGSNGGNTLAVSFCRGGKESSNKLNIQQVKCESEKQRCHLGMEVILEKAIQFLQSLNS